MQRHINLVGKRADLAPLVVFACGNPSRGDDALGPYLLARLQGWLEQQSFAERCELIVDFQLQIEHALDLLDRRLALFIDAGQRTPAPYIFRCARAQPQLAPCTHVLSPETLLAVLPRISSQLAPPAFVLCVRGESFVLGEDLSAAAREHAEEAFRLLTRLCRAAEAAVWKTFLSPAA